jgi:hypothetical protein
MGNGIGTFYSVTDVKLFNDENKVCVQSVLVVS